MISPSLTFGENGSPKQAPAKARRKHTHTKPSTHDIPLISLASSSALKHSEAQADAPKAQSIHYSSFPSDLRNKLSEEEDTPDSFERQAPSVQQEAIIPTKESAHDEIAPSISTSSKASLHTPEAPQTQATYESFPTEWLDSLPKEPEEEIPAEASASEVKKPESQAPAQSFSMASLIQTPLQWLFSLKYYFFASKPNP